MSIYTCSVRETEFDESKEGRLWEQLPDDWVCLVCESGKSFWQKTADASAGGRPGGDTVAVLDDGAVPEKTFDDFETYMADIHTMAETGQSIIEPMRTRQPTFTWDDILIKGAQLAKLPLSHDQPVRTKTVIGSGVAHPLVIDAPIFITHMSYGALSKEAKVALAKGSAAVKTAMCSGEGGILPASFENAHKYIFEYVPDGHRHPGSCIEKTSGH